MKKWMSWLKRAVKTYLLFGWVEQWVESVAVAIVVDMDYQTEQETEKAIRKALDDFAVEDAVTDAIEGYSYLDERDVQGLIEDSLSDNPEEWVNKSDVQEMIDETDVVEAVESVLDDKGLADMGDRLEELEAKHKDGEGTIFISGREKKALANAFKTIAEILCKEND